MSVTRRERRVAQRNERQEEIKRQRDRFKVRQRNKRIINYALLALVIGAIAYATYAMTRAPPAGAHDALARCLTEKGAIMYGTDWCPHCQAQKQRFGKSFTYVNYINCDLNADACTLAGVEGYPTWVFPNGQTLAGEQDLELLATMAGCADGS